MIKNEELSPRWKAREAEEVEPTDEIPGQRADRLNGEDNKKSILGDEGGFVAIDLLTPGLDYVKDIKKGLETLALPTAKSPEHLRAAELLGSKLGSMHRDGEVAAFSLRKERRAIDKMGVHNKDMPLDQNPGIKAMSDMSMGRPVSPEFRSLATKAENFWQDRLKKLEGAGVPLETLREHYFPGMWTMESRRAFNQAMKEAIDQGIGMRGAIEEPASGEYAIREPRLEDWTNQEKAWVKNRVKELLKVKKGSDKDGMQYLTKRPFKGKESFRKEKVFDDIMTGVEFGLEPISNNPADLILLKLAEMDRSIMANRALREWESKNDVITVNNAGQPMKKALRPGFDPTEWKKIDDPYGTIWHKNEDTKLWERVGYRVAKESVADVLNNYLSSSLYNSTYFGKPFKAWMTVANALNQFQLGVGSAFHAGFTSIDVQISANANVLKDIYGVARGNRTVGDLSKTVLKAPVAMGKTSREGARLLREWRMLRPTEIDVPVDVPVSQLPQIEEVRVGMIAKAVEMAGGGFKLEHGLRTEWTDKAIREWYGGEKLKAALRSPFTLVELTAKPIMEWLVPRQKAGVFGELAGRIIDMNPDKTLDELRPELRQAWNRVDARLGQVRYDRLFMNNVAKNVIQATVRAPGWTGGTIAEVGGAPSDLGKFFVEWGKEGRAPKDFPDRAAYVIALLTTVLTANGLLNYAFTGEKPEGVDWWAFRTGGYDEYGRPERFILPSYVKDLFAYWQDVGHTVLAKTHPLIGVVGDIIRNKDYYNVEIRNPDDPIHQRAVDVAIYGLKQFIPFWIRGAGKEAQRGGGVIKTLTEEPAKILAPEVGIMPATSAYTMSAFEKYAREVQTRRHPMGTITKQQAEKRMLIRDLELAVRRGDVDAQTEIREAKREGKITDEEAQDIPRKAKEDPIKRLATSLDIDDLARGVSRANEEEKRILKPIFETKYFNKSEQLDRETKDRYLEVLNNM